MKKITNIYLTAMLVLATSCANEAPFKPNTDNNGYGKVLTSSLAVQLQDAKTRAENVDVKEFTVRFLNTDNESEPVQTYLYKDMPEIVILPANSEYMVVADYGELQPAAFDAPCYYGESQKFKVDVDKIVDNIDPIKCKLINVKVTVNFDEKLVNAMSDNSKVTVNIGKKGELEFNKNTTKSGYFEYNEGSPTLTAIFEGSVDGADKNETKTYNDVKPGTHYKITFRLHKPDPTGTGNVTTGDDEENRIAVDAAVVINDLGGEDGLDITPEKEFLLDNQTERPGEDPGSDPNNPVGPTITAENPIDLDDWNVNPKACVLNIRSKSGITGFIVDIESAKLTPEELAGVGLSAHMDLIEGTDGNGNDLSEGLIGLGFPVKQEVEGQNKVKFDITNFLPLLGALGEADHKFILTVTDSDGTTVKELKLKLNNK